MASINKVLIMGNLGQDPELRYTQSQTPVVTLRVATNETRMDRDGQRQTLTEWHRVIVWGKQAENCAKYLSKGRPVFVEGRLQTRSWEDRASGQKRYTTEINANNVQFMSVGSERPEGSGGYASSNTGYDQVSGGSSGVGQQAGGYEQFPPAQEPSQAGGQYGNGNDQGDLDEIPF